MCAAAVDKGQGHGMQCMEIWGGNQAVRSAVSMPGIDAWVVSQPHGQSTVGGDIHYVSMCGSGRISRFVVADVSGHGDSVGQLSARLRSLMRKYINTLNQSRFVRELNREFSAGVSDGKFATALLTTYFAPKDHLVICNAGHPPPLWHRAKDESWQYLQEDLPDCVRSLSNLPLGVIAPTRYHQFAVPLDKNDLVLIYTDWLIEARNAQGRQLGPEGLLELVRQIDTHDPHSFCNELLDAVARYRDHAAPDDDVTVLLLRHNASDPPVPSLGEMAKVVGKLLHIVKV
jgi:sigma-B regulation protein RsbU (phosphoserine phosphatase)